MTMTKMEPEGKVGEVPAERRDGGARVAAGVRFVARRSARVSGLLVGIILLCVVFTFLSPPGSFASIGSVVTVARAMSTMAIVGCGVMLVIIVAEIDLSFGYLYGLCGNLLAVLWITWGWPVWLAIAAAFAVAVALATFNAFFVTIARIPSFIVTLGSGALVLGFTLFVGHAATWNPAYPPVGYQVDPGDLAFFQGLSNQKLPFNFPMQALWMIGVALVFFWFLHRSLFGFRLLAVGGNAEGAHLAGIHVRRYKYLAFLAGSVMACLASVLDFSFIGSVNPNAGQSLLFPVFSAVIIGGTSLYGGRGTVGGTLLGALLLAILTVAFALLAAGTFAAQIMLGVVTITAVAVDQLSHRKD